MLAEPDVAAVSQALRRVFARRVVDGDQLDDLVQETLTRIVKARPELAGDELIAYAIVTARNTLIAAARRRQDLPPSLARDLTTVDDPASLAVRSEERDAVRRALASLPEDDRQTLVAHEVEGRTTRNIAARVGTSPGAIAARLARVRARARVDYVVALRNVSLPTERCHSVLVSLSSGLRRRQAEVGAAEHLLSCEICADLAPAVRERRRSLDAIVPIAGVPALLGRIRRALAQHPVAAGGIATAAVVAVIAGVTGVTGIDTGDSGPAGGGESSVTVRAPASTVSRGSTASTSSPEQSQVPATPATSQPPTPPTTTAPAAPPPPVDTAACEVLDVSGAPVSGLGGLAGATVALDGAIIVAAPGDSGFWAACGPAQVWVQLVGLPLLGPVPVTAGQRIGVVGMVTTHGPGYAGSVGVTVEEGAVELDTAGVHIEAPPAAVTILT